MFGSMPLWVTVLPTTDVKRSGDTHVEFPMSPKLLPSGSMISLVKLSGGG
jgi:hypothetical protein